MPGIRHGIKVSQRPTAVLFRDAYYGYRDEVTGLPVTHSPVWTEWDFALLDAVGVLEDYTTESGHLVWVQDSEDIAFKAVKKIDKAQAAIDQSTKGSAKKPYEAAPGERWITEPVLRYTNSKWPTMAEWAKKQVAEIESERSGEGDNDVWDFQDD